ncbi:P-loop containing nucleoside triphosphate hydrolase protein [Lepidopterella palustris CBS 459.81]|uniref:P-loop containing nucleoside triphosphate hydrolase protein n=1 Tax=Lepidopterella palustris CBS 459.81 TaxID=1314670 RepID=A0A8E2DWV9_9PEZI|nr:P-loop containing nucleoside triphosphate hydrolase protein [Lepidopterella palustris CBS 459.81]
MDSEDIEDEIVARQLRFPEVKVTFLSLYCYSSKSDCVLLAISAVCAIIAGGCQPLPAIVFAKIVYVFAQIENTGHSQAGYAAIINHNTLYLVYITIATFLTRYVSTVGFIYLGEKLTRNIKEHYMEAVLRQNMAIFDEQGAGDITTQLTSDTNLIQAGLSHKLGLTFSAFGTMATTFVIGFIFSWKLTLILTWPVVLGVILLIGGKRFAIRYGAESLKAYSAGGAIAEEAIGSFKSTTGLGMQPYIVDRYSHYLNLAEKSGFRLKSFMGCMSAFAVGACYLNVALAFWQGSRFLANRSTSFSHVVAITLIMKNAAFSVLGVTAHIGTFTSAVAAATKIFRMIERTSPIDPSSIEGLTPSHVAGAIEFRDVKHTYPSRPEVVVAKGLNIIFPPGKTTAVVGTSGSGKSTIIHLIERFYDPTHGQVLLDGRDIRTLNIQWLRHQIRLISQEPALLDTTIAENIEHGLVGTEYENVAPEEKELIVQAAAKMASAHDFIIGLAQGYQTHVGSRGSKLSGGQKQRIAIARAVAAGPRILILDEATSALDGETERKVQAALSSSSAGRTTIVVAHRLSTIRDADKIVVLSDGSVIEQGTHDELFRLKGAYHRLVQTQTHETAPEKASPDSHTAPIEEELPAKEITLHEESELKISPTVDHSAGESHASLISLLKFVASLNIKELPVILVGLVCSILAGCEEPAAAFLLGKAIVAISLPEREKDQIQTQADFWSLMFLTLALIQCLVFSIQGIAFAYCSERLIHRARYLALQSILYQEVAFFDRKENSAGALTSFLSTEATHLSSISGATLGTILIAVSTLVAGFVVGCVFGWKLALVCSTVIPVLVGCGFAAVWFVGQFQRLAVKYNQISASYASEIISAIHTITALARQSDVLQHFRESLEIAGYKSLKSNLKASFMYALAQSLFSACMALGFWYGGTLVVHLEYSLLQFAIVYSSILMSAFSAGLIFQFAPDMGQAKQSASSLKALLQSKSSIDPRMLGGICPENLEARVEFRSVYFQYPSRPQSLALRDISFTVQPGEHVALVGETGCGKSTIFSLLERFYDPLSGEILVDGISISSLNISKYRRWISLVIQEPTLYDGTIRSNLIAGLDVESVSDAAIEAACKDANIYEFIISLPQGFATLVGNRGSKLSGGQRQRLALARALLRDPKILLLDEATSSIDSQSEALIQSALDIATRGRTTITIAHRLSTIEKADVIYVLHQGQIVESGSHEELLAKRARYYKLYGASA